MVLENVPGRFACICRDWQESIEPRNFRILQVGSDEHSFTNLHMTFHNKPWRQSYVRHIWFKIELPDHCIEKRSRPQTDEEINEDRICFATAIFTLFYNLEA
ncbi:hypothetical protein BDP55DRAFT_653264 [Colletotrichum godetiae]|uniref:Uncharacterized protein n=1 Tax=Colletotrichum godetiae TaxID=1209918 RepID=A0AAJ0ASC1_9PEZI|nr:uncharacterized protein BDP55DRAFT_653264 [Colletotrichum godetiae]KAK1689474.1 hypothetical protein BDP55DRAFT_653264 [Colletotrichum godetiae]